MSPGSSSSGSDLKAIVMFAKRWRGVSGSGLLQDEHEHFDACVLGGRTFVARGQSPKREGFGMVGAMDAASVTSSVSAIVGSLARRCWRRLSSTLGCVRRQSG